MIMKSWTAAASVCGKGICAADDFVGVVDDDDDDDESDDDDDDENDDDETESSICVWERNMCI